MQFDNFGIQVCFDVDEVVASVSGEVDILTAPVLGAVLHSLVGEGDMPVVLDLADLEFMDAAGLRVIADLSNRLAESGAKLTVRSAPPYTLRILHLTHVADLVRLDAPEPSATSLRRGHRSGVGSTGAEAESTDLTVDLVRVAARRANTEILDAALGLIAQLASTTVEGADGVSVTLNRQGRLRTVAFSDDTIRRMDDHQYETGEGPCLAAAAEGQRFHISSLADEDRWPAFVPRAIGEGIASILSTPLVAADRSVGALNIYSRTEGAFGSPQDDLATFFAAHASAILTGAGPDVTDVEMRQRIEAALLARETIAQAQGVHMARDEISSEAAASVLHKSARAGNLSVLAEAIKVVLSAGAKPRSGKGGRDHD